MAKGKVEKSEAEAPEETRQEEEMNRQVLMQRGKGGGTKRRLESIGSGD